MVPHSTSCSGSSPKAVQLCTAEGKQGKGSTSQNSERSLHRKSDSAACSSLPLPIKYGWVLEFMSTSVKSATGILWKFPIMKTPRKLHWGTTRDAKVTLKPAEHNWALFPHFPACWAVPRKKWLKMSQDQAWTHHTAPVWGLVALFSSSCKHKEVYLGLHYYCWARRLPVELGLLKIHPQKHQDTLLLASPAPGDSPCGCWGCGLGDFVRAVHRGITPWQKIQWLPRGLPGCSIRTRQPHVHLLLQMSP